LRFGGRAPPARAGVRHSTALAFCSQFCVPPISSSRLAALGRSRCTHALGTQLQTTAPGP